MNVFHSAIGILVLASVGIALLEPGGEQLFLFGLHPLRVARDEQCGRVLRFEPFEMP